MNKYDGEDEAKAKWKTDSSLSADTDAEPSTTHSRRRTRTGGTDDGIRKRQQLEKSDTAPSNFPSFSAARYFDGALQLI